MKSVLLPEFQEYLRSKSLVNEKYIQFYAHWASQFLVFSTSNNNLSHDLRVRKFTDHLESNAKIADWQIKQADNAVRLYVHHFLDSRGLTSQAPLPQNAGGNLTIPKLLEDMRQALRIKHYAYRTELAYLEGAEKFIR